MSDHRELTLRGLANVCVPAEQIEAATLDGITRHTPEGLWFRRYAQRHGFKAAIAWRDSGRPIPERDEAR
jgi:enoyl-CoA hydratase